MIDYIFKNDSGKSVGFRIGERYSWSDGAEMIVSVSDVASVDLRFTFKKFKKNVTTLAEASSLVRGIGSILNEEFSNNTAGYKITFREPEKLPYIEVDIVNPLLYVNDETSFTVTARNIDDIRCATRDKKVAVVTPDIHGRTIRAVGVGRTELVVGNPKYNRRFTITVDNPPESVADENSTDTKEK